MILLFVTGLLQTVHSVPTWQGAASVCRKFPNPVNGILFCRTDYCVVRCNEGFDFETEPAKGYFCHPSGVWAAMPTNNNVPWPNCTVRDAVKTPEERTLHTVGGGSNVVQIEQNEPGVPDAVSPSIENCPQDIVMTSETEPVQVRWEEPEISVNSGAFVSVTSISSGSFFRFGTHIIKYTAHDQSGNESSCQFEVIINRNLAVCPIKPPSDGALVCGTFSYPIKTNNVKRWQFCIPFCIRGTDFHPNIGLVSFCRFFDSSPSWFHHNQSWHIIAHDMPQSCNAQSGKARQGDKLQYYDGECAASVQSLIQQVAKQLVANDPFVASQCILQPDICGKYNLSDLSVHCGPGNIQRDIESPLVVACPQNINVQTSKGNSYWNELPVVSWKEPVFEDNTKGPITVLKGGSDINNGDRLPYGDYSMVYIATDRAGNTAKCSFEISVKPFPCAMELPANGAMVCGYPTVEGMDLMTMDCVVLCAEEYQFSSKPYPIYACSEEGVWWPFTSTLVPIGPHFLKLNQTCSDSATVKGMEAVPGSFYYNGHCQERDVQEELMGRLESFQRRTSAYRYCETNKDLCRKWKGYRNVTVFCDDW